MDRIFLTWVLLLINANLLIRVLALPACLVCLLAFPQSLFPPSSWYKTLSPTPTTPPPPQNTAQSRIRSSRLSRRRAASAAAYFCPNSIPSYPTNTLIDCPWRLPATVHETTRMP
ncbi:hypothetical protein LZ30DRAFT_234189 [Colletotrichum cereale]|nr:hypothetical protein LZ30DRAFT_234189 [Colletotrichum cereale]